MSASHSRKASASPPPRPNDPGIFTVSNLLSFLRLLLVIPLVLVILPPMPDRTLALVICAVAYLTDIADGYLARRLHQESTFGKMLDPIADKVVIGGFVLALFLKDLVPLWYLLLVVGRDLLILVGALWIRTRARLVVQSNLLGKATVISIGLALLASLFRLSINSGFYLGLMLISVALIVVSLVSYGERLKKATSSSTR